MIFNTKVLVFLAGVAFILIGILSGVTISNISEHIIADLTDELLLHAYILGIVLVIYAIAKRNWN